MRKVITLTSIFAAIFLCSLLALSADADDHVNMTFIQTLSDDKASVNIKGITTVKEGYEIVGIQEEGKERITATTIETTVTENKEYSFTVFYKVIQKEIKNNGEVKEVENIEESDKELSKQFKVTIEDIQTIESKTDIETKEEKELPVIKDELLKTDEIEKSVLSQKNANSLTVNDTFIAKLEGNLLSQPKIDCTFKILKEPENGTLGEVQVGSGAYQTPAVSKEINGTYILPNTVTYNGSEYTVVAIGDYAFYNCASFTSLRYNPGNSLKTIGNSAFNGCSMLVDTGLSMINVTSIGESSFLGTRITETGLEENNSLISVAPNAFSFNYRLRSTGLESNTTLVTLGNAAFTECRALKSTGLEGNTTIKHLGYNVFENCTSLLSTGLENNTTVITVDKGAIFRGCTALRSTGLEGNGKVTNVGYQTFALTGIMSTGLENNKTVKFLEELAFSECKEIKKVVLPIDTAIEEIQVGAFKGCTNLKSFVFKGRIIPVLHTTNFGNRQSSFASETIVYVPLGTSQSDIERVSEFGNECKIIPITNIELDESNLLNEYQVGDEFKLDGLNLNITYELKDIIEAYDCNVVYDNEKANFSYQPVILKSGDNKVKVDYLGIPLELNIHIHDYSSEWSSDQTNHWKECSCGDKQEISEHISSDYIIDKESTHEEKGSQHKECTICKKILETKELELKEKVYTYEIIQGANSQYKVDSQIKNSLRIDGDYKKFKGIMIDNIEVDKTNYISREGSTIIELKPEYLNTLEVGTYKLKVMFEDREVITELTILEKDKLPVIIPPIPHNPDVERTNQVISTGDNTSVAYFMVSIVLSSLGLCIAKGCQNKKVGDM